MERKTIYNGDIIDGVPVITKLNIDDLAPGKIYRFMFKGADMGIGQSWYVPVLVAIGAHPGKKLLLNTGIHGDEFNGSKVIHTIFNDLNLNHLSGAIVGVVQANPNALLHIHRHWYSSNWGGEYINLNRVFPGQKDGNAAEVHAYKLWNYLYLNNADYVIDLHTQTTDTEFPVFIYADYSVPNVQELAELFPADIIKVDMLNQLEDEQSNNCTGTVEYMFNSVNIPVITLEMGAPRSYQERSIQIALEGIHNILINAKMIKGKIGRTAASVNTFIGKDMHVIHALVGGYAELAVKLGDKVEKGQKVAIQRNVFGDIIKTYFSPYNGIVASIGTGAIREQGGMLAYILTKIE